MPTFDGHHGVLSVLLGLHILAQRQIEMSDPIPVRRAGIYTLYKQRREKKGQFGFYVQTKTFYFLYSRSFFPENANKKVLRLPVDKGAGTVLIWGWESFRLRLIVHG